LYGKFCAECGTLSDLEADVLVQLKFAECPSCKQKNASHLKFCGECGSLLHGQSAKKNGAKQVHPIRSSTYVSWNFDSGEIARKLTQDDIRDVVESGALGFLILDGQRALVYIDGQLFSEVGAGKHSFLSKEEELKLEQAYNIRKSGVLAGLGVASKAVSRFFIGVSAKDKEEERLKDYEILRDHLASSLTISVVLYSYTPFVNNRKLSSVSYKNDLGDLTLSVRFTLGDLKNFYDEFLVDTHKLFQIDLEKSLFGNESELSGYFVSFNKTVIKYTVEEIVSFDKTRVEMWCSLQEIAPSFINVLQILSVSANSYQPPIQTQSIRKDEGVVPFGFTHDIFALFESANKGDAVAQFALARAFETGNGAPHNPEEALVWYVKSAEIGHQDAMFNMGVIYESGEGVKRDLRLAIEWYSKAAAHNHELARKRLHALTPSYPRAGTTEFPGYTKDTLELFAQAEEGIPVAQFKLGLRYSNGNGAPKDSQAAVNWYLKAAHQNEAAAQNNLALKYKAGDGIEKNHTEAFRWCFKAAESGFAIAQYNLGDFYEKGIGVSKDPEKAIYWYRMAAAQGDEDATLRLKQLI
jgi:TPR repeat protein